MLRLEGSGLKVNSQTGRQGSGHVGAEGLSQGVGCVSSGMESHWSQEAPVDVLIKARTL